MNGYQIAEVVLNLWAIGVQRDAIRARLAEARANGLPESEVPKILDKWYEEARQEAITAQPDPGSNSAGA